MDDFPLPGGIGVSHLRAYDWAAEDGVCGGSPHLHLACTEAYVVTGGQGAVQTLSTGGYVETPLEAGVIARYILGDPEANAFVGGCALTSDFIKSRPEAAKRFTAAWEKAARLINENPAEARKHLVRNTFTPEDVVDTVPMVRYFMVKDLSDKDKADFQKFIDFSVQAGTLEQKIDVTKYLQAF